MKLHTRSGTSTLAKRTKNEPSEYWYMKLSAASWEMARKQSVACREMSRYCSRTLFSSAAVFVTSTCFSSTSFAADLLDDKISAHCGYLWIDRKMREAYHIHTDQQ